MLSTLAIFGVLSVAITCDGASFLSQDVSDLIRAVSKVCYDGYGCFSNAPPFTSSRRPLSLLPQSPGKIGTKFHLYTRANKLNQDVVTPANLAASRFQPKKPTKIIIHGFFGKLNNDWIRNIRDQYLKYYDVNVIVVEWTKGAGLPYTQATANTRLVGVQTEILVRAMVKMGAKLSDIHLIGHSLGAHTASYVGDNLKPQKIGRITGLDPAEPYFQFMDIKVRLDPTDAAFVDVIHTDANGVFGGVVSGNGGFGLWQPSGHLDFYPNGGKAQPGCSGTYGNIGCDHGQAPKYFSATINPECSFKGYECDSYETFNSGACFSSCSDGKHQCAEMGARSKPARKQRAEVMLFLKTGVVGYCGNPGNGNIRMSVNLLNLNGVATDRGQIYLRVNTNGFDIRMKPQPLLVEEGYLTPGETQTGVVFVTEPFERIRGVEISWKHVPNRSKPLEWPANRRDTAVIYPASITLESDDGRKRRTFRKAAQKLEPDTTRYFM